MAASPTERSWCVLEFALCNSFVVVQRAFRQQFGRRGAPETSIRRWYEQFRYRGCICHQGNGRAGRPSVTEETVDRVRETHSQPQEICAESQSRVEDTGAHNEQNSTETTAFVPVQTATVTKTPTWCSIQAAGHPRHQTWQCVIYSCVVSSRTMFTSHHFQRHYQNCESASTPQSGTSHKTCLGGFGGNGSIAWTSAVSHVGRTSNALKVTMKLQTFLFQMVVTSCISVQYLWKYGFAKSCDNLYPPCILTL